jgi:hypothetical protein
MRLLLDTLRGRMSDDEEHQPGANAPVTAHYEELNVFGSVTGKTVHVREGERGVNGIGQSAAPVLLAGIRGTIRTLNPLSKRLQV